MSFFFKSRRIGKGGRVFTLYKLKTLHENITHFPYNKTEQYTWGGKFLRKTKLDELPQLWNLIKRDINIVGPRPEEENTIHVIPQETRDILLSVRPGLTSLASIHFFDEGQILEQSTNTHEDYWSKIKPLKITLDVFYVQNKSWLLDLAIIWLTIKKIIKSLFHA